MSGDWRRGVINVVHGRNRYKADDRSLRARVACEYSAFGKRFFGD